MKGYIENIEKETLGNENFRKVLFTGPHLQLVVMSILPQEEIGEEIHEADQFIRIEDGEGKVILDGEESSVSEDFVIIIPSGTKHNIINTSVNKKLKLYSIYAPAEHPDGVVDATKEAANTREENS